MNIFWRLAKGVQISLSSGFESAISFPPGHFYSPLPARDDVLRALPLIRPTDTTHIADVDVDFAAQLALLEQFAQYRPELPIPVKPAEGFRSYLDNPFFSFGDSIILYSMMRHFRPRQIVEVGSGFSSAVMLDVAERFGMADTRMTFIDPYPERLNGLLRDSDPETHSVLVQGVQSVDLAVFTALQAGDFLFVDSSHVGKFASDVLHILFNVLPVVQPGVIIHFHDITWPFEYPRVWLEAGRAWNEVYFLRAFLQNNPHYEIVYFNSAMATLHSDQVEAALPLACHPSSLPMTIPSASLWLRKRG